MLSWKLPTESQDGIGVQSNSDSILKAIESHHGLIVERARGIYSFSHLTFQEYFVSKTFVNGSDQEKQRELANHIIERKWWEVFRLTAGALNSSDQLMWLAKQRIDQILASDDLFQQFIKWIENRSQLLDSSRNRQSIRSFLLYCGLTLNHVFTANISYWVYPRMSYILDSEFRSDTEDCLWLDWNLIVAYVRGHYGFRWTRPVDKDSSPFLGSDFLARALTFLSSSKEKEYEPLNTDLELLEKEIPDWKESPDAHMAWWKEEEKRQAWAKRLGEIIIKHRGVSQSWHFDDHHEREAWAIL